MKKQTAQQLIRIVAEQMELNPTDKEFGEILNDVSSNGAAAGWPGFTYTADIKTMYETHGGDLLQILQECVEVQEEDNLESFVRSFHGLKGYRPVDGWYVSILRVFQHPCTTKVEYDTMIADHLAWFFLEEAANAYFNWPRATWGGDE